MSEAKQGIETTVPQHRSFEQMIFSTMAMVSWPDLVVPMPIFINVNLGKRESDLIDNIFGRLKSGRA